MSGNSTGRNDRRPYRGYSSLITLHSSLLFTINSLKPSVKIYKLHDTQQYEDEREFWNRQTAEYKLMVLETLRRVGLKLVRNEDGSIRRFPPNGAPSEEKFFRLLNDHNVQYLVVGGYAFAIYARPRFTNDLDIWILDDKENAERVMGVLEDFGFCDLNISVDDLINPEKVIQLGYPPLRIDLMTSIDGVEFPQAWQCRDTSSYGSQKVNFICKQDLIRNKRASGRPIDLHDLKELE